MRETTTYDAIVFGGGTAGVIAAPESHFIEYGLLLLPMVQLPVPTPAACEVPAVPASRAAPDWHSAAGRRGPESAPRPRARAKAPCPETLPPQIPQARATWSRRCSSGVASALACTQLKAMRTDSDITSPFGTTDNRQHQRSAYAQGVIPLTQRFSATLGARHAEVENDLTDSFSYPAGTSIDDSEFVTSAGLSFAATSEWRLFARRDGHEPIIR